MARRRLIRLLGAALSVVLALQLAFSLVWLGRELHHEYTGEACPICQAMGQVARAVTQGAARVAAALALVPALLVITAPSLYDAPELPICTLVTLGVRLDT